MGSCRGEQDMILAKEKNNAESAKNKGNRKKAYFAGFPLTLGSRASDGFMEDTTQHSRSGSNEESKEAGSAERKGDER
jgi:hypothetical protein